MISTTYPIDISFPSMLKKVALTFPGRDLQNKVHFIFRALFEETNIENIFYSKWETRDSERGFKEKIVVILDTEYYLTGRIKTLIAPSRELRLPRVIEFDLDEDEGAMGIDHGIIQFVKGRAPIEYIPVNRFETMKAFGPNESRYCEAEWSELANRVNYGAILMMTNIHTENVDFCKNHGHFKGGSIIQVYSESRLSKFMNPRPRL